jgi:small subunit ribosomal protein S3Ae
MAKARSRAAARKIKDRWRSKNWYNIVTPPFFDSMTIADTLTDNPDNLINRVTEVSLQELTNDFRKSHITLHFKINKITDSNAHTQFVGHSLTSDYLRRMIRRRRSKIEGVYDVRTRDGAVVRIKPFATTDKRIQNSQRRVVREAMKNTIYDVANKSTLSEFVKYILDGKIGSDIYKNCRKLYPVKRVEIFKTEVISQPTIVIEDKKPKKKEEPTEPEEKEEKPKKKKEPKETEKTEEEKPKKKDEKKEKTEEPIKEEEKKKKTEETKEEEKPKPKKTAKKTTAKNATKKITAKKTVTKKETKKPAAKKTSAEKTTKKKTTKK